MAWDSPFTSWDLKTPNFEKTPGETFLRGVLTKSPATTGIFPPSNLSRDAVYKNENFFFEKILFLQICCNFSNFKNFLIVFRKKNFTIKVQKTFLRKIIIWYEFFSKFATFTDFEKIECFFSKKHIYFSNRNPNFVSICEISVAFYGKFVIIFLI